MFEKIISKTTKRKRKKRSAELTMRPIQSRERERDVVNISSPLVVDVDNVRLAQLSHDTQHD